MNCFFLPRKGGKLNPPPFPIPHPLSKIISHAVPALVDNSQRKTPMLAIVKFYNLKRKIHLYIVINRMNNFFFSLAQTYLKVSIL